MLASFFCVFAAAGAAAAGTLDAQIDHASGAFNITVGGELWLRGLAPTANWATSFSATAGPAALVLLRTASSSGSHPQLGDYEETRFFWRTTDSSSRNQVPVETAFQVFADGSTILCEQRFPEGLDAAEQHEENNNNSSNNNNNNNNNDGRPLLAFPDFRLGGAERRLGAATWVNTFSQLAGNVR